MGWSWILGIGIIWGFVEYVSLHNRGMDHDTGFLLFGISKVDQSATSFQRCAEKGRAEKIFYYKKFFCFKDRKSVV